MERVRNRRKGAIKVDQEDPEKREKRLRKKLAEKWNGKRKATW